MLLGLFQLVIQSGNQLTFKDVTALTSKILQLHNYILHGKLISRSWINLIRKSMKFVRSKICHRRLFMFHKQLKKMQQITEAENDKCKLI
jgi:hypothetical protein